MKEKRMQLRTDFCDELIHDEHYDDTLSCVIKQVNNCKVTHIKIHQEKNVLEKEKGDYITIEFDGMNDYEQRMMIIHCIEKKMLELFTLINKEIKKILIIGLGNRSVVSDALGPKCIDKILVTSHLYKDKRYELLDGTRNIATMSPGVMGQTGLESAEIVCCITNMYKPDLVIVVDALATSSIDRINKAIQLNNTGIKPGSGVGNYRMELSEATLGVPLIAIGVATVTSVGTILKEAITKLKKEELLEEIAAVMDTDLIVTPKNMDDTLNDLITILSESINHVVHPKYEEL